MKTIIKIAVCLLLVSSCGISKFNLQPNELVKFSNRNDTIFYNQKPIGFLYNMEYELYRGNLTHELSLVQIDEDPDHIIGLIKYAHTLHPNSKIEVKHK